MLPKLKPNSPTRGQRHSAAWGKRLSLLVLLLVAETAFAQHFALDGTPTGKFGPDLAPLVERVHRGGASPNETVKVIVQYRQAPRTEQESRVQRLGGHLNHRLSLIRGTAFTIPATALTALEADSEVVSVTVDHPVRKMDATSDDATNVPAAWSSGYTGAGIGVAVIDSGINDSHPDLWNSSETASRVVYHQDFTGTPTTNLAGAKYDLYGHGTHVAGIVGGNGYLSSGAYIGVAPKVNLVDLRALNGLGVGSDSTVIAAIQEAIAIQNKYNIQVVNLSLGRGIFESYAQDPLCQAVESAWKSGLVVVVAAGNYGRVSIDGSDGYGTITAPGNDPFVITVGAMNSTGSSAASAEIMTSYTSKGPTTYDHVVKPDLMAPGNQIVSLAAPGAALEALFPAELVNGNNGKADYFTLSGTSMATPMVSGAAALLIQQNPNMTPDQVKARLMQTTYSTFPTSTVINVPALDETFTEYYDTFSVGAGLLNMQAALNDNDLAPGNLGAALSPYVTAAFSARDGSGTVAMVDGNASIAPNSVVWGSSWAWAFSNIWVGVSGNSVVWGSSLPWNDNLLTAFSVVWGSSTGTGAQACSVVWGSSQTTPDFDALVAGDN